MVTLHSRDKNSNLYAGLENPPQVCHPEPLIPPGTESSSDCVLKHFVDPEECEDARLEVRHSHLFGCCSSWDENILFENKNSIFNLTLLGHYDVSLLNLSVRVWKIFFSVISVFLPDKRTPLFTIPQILLVFVDEPRVVLTANQDDRSLRTEPPDLMVPHCPIILLMYIFSKLPPLYLPAVF